MKNVRSRKAGPIVGSVLAIPRGFEAEIGERGSARGFEQDACLGFLRFHGRKSRFLPQGGISIPLVATVFKHQLTERASCFGANWSSRGGLRGFRSLKESSGKAISRLPPPVLAIPVVFSRKRPSRACVWANCRRYAVAYPYRPLDGRLLSF